ncbi:MAG: MBL fold metallo-hydrolase [Candidatus Eisenbacteria sp.]|nr:MBL fold metallo-hydrolase [Candidatus Eisenbacteria bacterium]
MRITFWGAARTVTGSRHLLEVQGREILLDCGLVQGRREEAEARNRHLPFEATDVAAVVLSHAHIDHSGNLPSLVKSGFEGPIHATRATAGLLDPMLHDSAHIQERDVEFVNKRRARKKQPQKQPLYTQADVERTLPLLMSQRYGTPFAVSAGVTACFRDAGHILGSAITVLDLEEGGRRLRLAFTGDLGRDHLPIIRDPETVADVDVLMIESTYGNRRHAVVAEVTGTVERLLNRAHERRGKVIIPAFAVGRTQEIVTVLKELFESGRVPAMPVYVDSPLAVNVTEVFREHEECFDEETLALLHDEQTDPFGFRRIHYVRDVEESKGLNAQEGPMIIISASGMCEAGRILHHLRNNIEDPRNQVLIIGFQAEHTLGRKLVEGWDEVPIFGERFNLRAEVTTIDAFSAHADQQELLTWVDGLSKRPRKVFVVHGEEEQSLAFAASLEEQGLPEVIVPELGQSFVL